MELNHNNLPAIINAICTSEASNKINSVTEIKSIFEDFQSSHHIKKRYANVLHNTHIQKQETKKNNKYDGCFTFRISRIYSYSKELITEYCKNNGIELNYGNISSPKLETLAREWKFNQIRDKVIYNFIHRSYMNEYYISKADSMKFIEMFKDEIYCDWGSFSENEFFDWNPKTIEIGSKLWNWQTLTTNPFVDWTFNLINKYKDNDDLKWTYLSAMVKWDLDHIREFQKYIFFDGGYSYDEKILLENKWVLHLDRSILHINGKKTELIQDFIVGNISDNRNINWNDELINNYIDKWDWNCLSKNTSIDWNQQKVEIYERYIDFNGLSENECIIWDIDFISKYENKLNFDKLVLNQSVFWTNIMFDKFKNRIDHFIFSKHAKFSPDIIINNLELWEFENIETHKVKVNSDGTFFYETKHKLWEFLLSNKNIVWDDTLIEHCISRIPLHSIVSEHLIVSVETINKYWDYNKTELIEYVEHFRGVGDEEIKLVYFRDCLRQSTITNLTFEMFKENEIHWWGVLNDFLFLNPTIKELLLSNLS